MPTGPSENPISLYVLTGQRGPSLSGLLKRHGPHHQGSTSDHLPPKGQGRPPNPINRGEENNDSINEEVAVETTRTQAPEPSERRRSPPRHYPGEALGSWVVIPQPLLLAACRGSRGLLLPTPRPWLSSWAARQGILWSQTRASPQAETPRVLRSEAPDTGNCSERRWAP